MASRSLDDLAAPVKSAALAMLARCRAAGLEVLIYCTLRSNDEQAALYAQGRTTGGEIVTNARGGYSNHNFGIAFDIGVFSGNRYLPESPLYKAVGALGMELGLECGGNWTSIVDQPHFQLRPAWASAMRDSAMLAELRRRTKLGESIT